LFVIPQFFAAVKKFIKDYLQFSKKERIGLGVLLLFMGLFLYLPRLIKPNTQPLQQSDTAWLNGLNYMDSGKNQHFQTANVNSTRPKPAYFYFDPNTATELQLLTLGLTPKNVQTILNYRNKGGQFRVARRFFKDLGD
jgi:competence protein ComEA